VTDLLASIEGSALAAWTRESPSIWAYPTILTLHTFGLAIVVGAAAVIDFRLLGMSPRIAVGALRSLFPIMWWAFALNFLTGILLFMSDATHKAGQGVFWVKLGLIVLAVLVTLPLRNGLEQHDPSAVTATPRLRTLAFLSLALWSAAIVAGRLLAYW
jgi:hypothetical protein